MLRALMMAMRCLTLGIEAKRGLYEGVAVPNVCYGLLASSIIAERLCFGMCVTASGENKRSNPKC